MLARNAEALYWIGRYAERADDTARMLDVTVHQFLEDATIDEDRASRQLVRVLGIPEPPADQPLDLGQAARGGGLADPQRLGGVDDLAMPVDGRDQPQLRQHDGPAPDQRLAHRRARHPEPLCDGGLVQKLSRLQLWA